MKKSQQYISAPAAPQKQLFVLWQPDWAKWQKKRI